MEPRHFPARPMDRDAPVRHMLTEAERGRGLLTGPFVYRFYDADRRPLYIGVTTGSATRWNGHRRTSEWWALAEFVAVSFYGTYEAAMEAEMAAIRAERPPFNKQGMKPRMQAFIRFEDGPEAIAAELHRIMPADLVSELADHLGSPERFPKPVPPPPPDFPEGM